MLGWPWIWTAQWAAEHALPTALQDLEPQQLLLFVQSFGIPVSSMSKLLQYLDQAVAQDPQTLEQNIMDKSKKPWGPRGWQHPVPVGLDCVVVRPGGHLHLYRQVLEL